MGDVEHRHWRAACCSPGTARLVENEPVVPAAFPYRAVLPRARRRGLAYAVPYYDTAARARPPRRGAVHRPARRPRRHDRLTDGGRLDPAADLLASDRFAPDYVAEPDDDGTVHLRFGGDVSGRRPRRTAVHRVATGSAASPPGNAGRELLTVPVPLCPA